MEHKKGYHIQRKAVGLQITHSWHWEVVTENINGPGAACGVELPVFWLLSGSAPSMPLTVKYMKSKVYDGKPCLNLFGGIFDWPEG